jgi:hypothetical protein
MTAPTCSPRLSRLDDLLARQRGRNLMDVAAGALLVCGLLSAVLALV